MKTLKFHVLEMIRIEYAFFLRNSKTLEQEVPSLIKANVFNIIKYWFILIEDLGFKLL